MGRVEVSLVLFSRGQFSPIDAFTVVAQKSEIEIMVDDLESHKLFSSVSGQDPMTTHYVIGLFKTNRALKQATGTLNRHQFVEKDLVQIINQRKISPEDAVNGQTTPLTEILLKLDLPPEKAKIYADRLKQGYLLLVVRTDVDRVTEAANILDQAQAEDIERVQPR